MFKIGLKLWSINDNYIKEAIRLYEKKVFDYIELFAVPNSYDKYINLWKSLKIPYVIHAAHSAVGLNLAKKIENNFLIKEALKFADSLDSKIIIFHPGISGDINLTIKNLNDISDSRIVIENKPYYTLDKKETCIGNLPEDIALILNNTKAGFCFDIAHAIYSANAQNIEVLDYLSRFNSLNPKIYHLSDGDFTGVIDEHKSLGKGSFDYEKVITFIKNKSLITLETKKNFKNSLSDFEEDVSFIRALECNYEKSECCNSNNKTLEY